jgi:mRNA-degrading endonuclease toxin of MazEF toxin-antitoxin module
VYLHSVALDQVRTVDRERLRKRLGVLSPGNLSAVLAILGRDVRVLLAAF